MPFPNPLSDTDDEMYKGNAALLIGDPLDIIPNTVKSWAEDAAEEKRTKTSEAMFKESFPRGFWETALGMVLPMNVGINPEEKRQYKRGKFIKEQKEILKKSDLAEKEKSEGDAK